MKNIQINVNLYHLSSGITPSQSGLTPIKQVTSVALNIQFDDEDEAIAFAKYMIENIQNYRGGL